MNVPHASHKGGTRELQISTVQNVLASLLSKHGTQLGNETLRTFMVEAEAIVNCRSLPVDTMNSPDMPEILTPNHLLTIKFKIILPFQVTSNMWTWTQERDGAEFSTLPTNSGISGRRNICNRCSQEKSGLAQVKI